VTGPCEDVVSERAARAPVRVSAPGFGAAHARRGGRVTRDSYVRPRACAGENTRLGFRPRTPRTHRGFEAAKERRRFEKTAPLTALSHRRHPLGQEGRPPGTSLFDPEVGALACGGPCQGVVNLVNRYGPQAVNAAKRAVDRYGPQAMNWARTQGANAAALVSRLSDKIASAVRGGVDIVGKAGHAGLRPTQLSVDRSIVQRYAAQLRAGQKVDPIHAIEIPDGRRFIIEGHHRYVASQLTGKPVDVRIEPGAGPVGFDWKDVVYETFSP
jgi:hypothetical protein